jgi:hypothetical protein
VVPRINNNNGTNVNVELLLFVIAKNKRYVNQGLMMEIVFAVTHLSTTSFKRRFTATPRMSTLYIQTSLISKTISNKQIATFQNHQRRSRGGNGREHAAGKTGFSKFEFCPKLVFSFFAKSYLDLT